MAGDWIKMRVDLVDDPAVIHLASVLSIDEYAVVGRLHKLWSWADKHCDNGHAKSVTFVWINRYIGHELFAESLQQVGWLDEYSDGVTFPKFDKHNGKSAKIRAEAQERKRKERNTPEVTEESGQMSQVLCDESVTREEKRREEKKEIKTLVISQANDKPDCPHREIISLYHEVLPQCPKVRDWTQARQTQLRTRWNESSDRQNLDYWRRLFEYVGECDFLTGRTAKPFFADLEWITKTANFTKIRERKYENRVAV